MSEPVRRLELFTGAGRRRTWSQDEKAAIVAESAASNISISAVARRHGLSVSHLFTWRRLARQEEAGDRRPELRFVPAVLMSEPLESATVETKAEPRRRSACTRIEVEVAGAAALVQLCPGVLQLSLPVSRRLNADTVQLIQPAFYPDMPFSAMSRDRSIQFPVAGVMPFDAALDAVAHGASIVHVELPPQITGEADAELAQELVASIERLLLRRACMSDDGRITEVRPADIGVVCAHVS